MIITKKQSKNLRYFARANYKSECKGVETENGKVKHREFPCFELAYDESKATVGNVELTNVTIGGKPFDGDYTALMTRLRELLDNPDDACAEELEQDKTLTEQAVDAVKDKSDTIVIAEKPGDIIKETLKDCFPEGSEISVDVKPKENRIDANVFIPNSGDHIDAKIEVKPVKEPEKNTIIVTGAVIPETHDSGRDYPGLSEEAIAEAYESVVSGSKGDMKPSIEPPVLEEAKQVVEETGKPVITAEQVSSVHLDAAADGSHDETAVFVPKEQRPKKLTRAELYDLQMKCGVMRLATLYGEDPDTKLDVLMKLYPDAATRLNEVYAADGIKTYTITEEAIQKAYPDEYAALRK